MPYRRIGWTTLVLITCAIPLTVGYAQEQADPYRLTETEKAACYGDAMRLCSETYPDEHRLLLCMKTNKASLSPEYLPVFIAGIKRRGL